MAIAERFARVATVAAAAGWAVAGALGVLAPATATAAPSHVGLVINGQGYCVSAGGTGYDLLDRAGVGVVIARDPAHLGMVQQIGGVPAATPIDAEHYWSYWRNSGNGWTYSGAGGASTRPAAGTVDGWRYVDGLTSAPAPAALSYDDLCGDKDQPAPPVAAEPVQPVPVPVPSSAPEPAPVATHEPTTAERTSSAGVGGQPDATPSAPSSGTPNDQPRSTDAASTVSVAGSSSPGVAGSTSGSASGTVLGAGDGGSDGGTDGGTNAEATVGVLAVAAALTGGAIWQSRRRSG